MTSATTHDLTHKLKDRLATLPPGDRRLILAMAVGALAALAVGVLGGLLTGLSRSGLIEVMPATAYRFLAVHGTVIFFYWLYLAQLALLLGLAAREDGRRLVLPNIAWLGFAAIGMGFVTSFAAIQLGMPLLYDGSPELAAEEPQALLIFNLGYVLLGVGLLLIPATAIATLLRRRREGLQNRLTALGFALFAWAGFLMVSGFAALHAFLPGALWAAGFGAFPTAHTANWHILFHNMHYLPLMATVVLWYVLMQELTGGRSVFGERLSKIVFSMYLVFVPPTSLYHMFLEPDLPAAMRVAGSLLSLFVSVPTLTAFLIIVASLEVHARARGGRGLFGWMRKLPWQHPATSAMAMAMVNMGLGLALAFVLIQEQLAPLLSDTFFVPGYFHFFTVGTVSLTLLGGLTVLLPPLTGRPLWRPGILRALPWVTTGGLVVFGSAGVVAGYLGVPRRVIDVTYGGDAPAVWQTLMAVVGVGGMVMAAALIALAAGLAASLIPWRTPQHEPERLIVAWGDFELKPGATAWVGPVSVLSIVGLMYVFTAIGFAVMRALPVATVGGAGH